MAAPIRVLLFDGYPILGAGVRCVLNATADMQFLAFVDHAADAARQCEGLQPDVLLFATCPGQRVDLTLLSTLGHQFPALRILLLLGKEQTDQVQAALQVGAVGVLLIEDPAVLLPLAIRAVHLGGTWFSPSFKPFPALQASVATLLDSREKELLALIARGWNCAAIAAELCLAPQTVRNRTSRLYRKLQVAGRTEAIVWALERLQPAPDGHRT